MMLGDGEVVLEGNDDVDGRMSQKARDFPRTRRPTIVPTNDVNVVIGF